MATILLVEDNEMNRDMLIRRTAKDLTPEDRWRLNGCVERILQKGAYSREKLLHEIHHLVVACLRSGRAGTGRV